MNYGSDPADQIVRFSLDGTEMVLKLSGLAAKNFALFVYAVLNDQQKVRGKTKLVRKVCPFPGGPFLLRSMTGWNKKGARGSETKDEQ